LLLIWFLDQGDFDKNISIFATAHILSVCITRKGDHCILSYIRLRHHHSLIHCIGSNCFSTNGCTRGGYLSRSKFTRKSSN
jgi:hypothetical protein